MTYEFGCAVLQLLGSQSRNRNGGMLRESRRSEQHRQGDCRRPVPEPMVDDSVHFYRSLSVDDPSRRGPVTVAGPPRRRRYSVNRNLAVKSDIGEDDAAAAARNASIRGVAYCAWMGERSISQPAIGDLKA
jgi:hypothetical protein